jgi:pimeloyl-ACP methyl ester carboxylesterase
LFTQTFPRRERVEKWLIGHGERCRCKAEFNRAFEATKLLRLITPASIFPDADGFLWLTVDAFRNAFAPDASPSETALMAAAQKPISLKCLGEPMTEPAWREKPSWFLIAEKDLMVSPETQRFTAARMHSKTVSLSVDHTPLASKPDAVAELITAAATSV